MTKKPKKIKKKKITKRSRYYRWIESVGADVKIYPCQHERPDYKAVVALQEKTMEELKKRDKEVEELQVKLGECIERLILNNKDHEEHLARYARLYVGYKKKYQGLFKLRDAAINMGITEEDEKEDEEEEDEEDEEEDEEEGEENDSEQNEETQQNNQQNISNDS